VSWLSKTAKLLFIFLFFSFSFSFRLTIHKECRKVLCHKCYTNHSHMIGSYNIISHDVTWWWRYWLSRIGCLQAQRRRWLLIYCKVERGEVVNCSCILLPYFCYKRLLKYSLATVSQATTSSTIKHPTNNKQKSQIK